MRGREGGCMYGSGYEWQRPRFQVGERVEVSSRAGLVPWVTSGVIAEVGWVYGKPIYRVDKVDVSGCDTTFKNVKEWMLRPVSRPARG